MDIKSDSASADLFIDENTFTYNDALAGGAVSVEGSVEVLITRSIFEKNTAKHNGGALYLLDTHNVSISAQTFFNLNSAKDNGGALSAINF